jgi:hypothetical protein
MPRERITIETAQPLIGLPIRTVQKMAAKGEIPGAAKMVRRWTFDRGPGTPVRAFFALSFSSVITGSDLFACFWERGEKYTREHDGHFISNALQLITTWGARCERSQFGNRRLLILAFTNEPAVVPRSSGSNNKPDTYRHGVFRPPSLR